MIHLYLGVVLNLLKGWHNMEVMYTFDYNNILHKLGFKNLVFTRENGSTILQDNNEKYLILEQLPTTCSTVYIGNISYYLYWLKNHPTRFPSLQTIINDFIFKLSNYTEIMVTVRLETIPDLLELGFKLLGDSFINKRTGHGLQHLHYMRKD